MRGKKTPLFKEKATTQKILAPVRIDKGSWLDINILWPMLAVAVLTFIVYISALKLGFTNWDDPVYVYENPFLKDLSFEGLKKLTVMNFAGNHHPITMLTLALNYGISGQAPFSYHFVNIILHLTNSLLVFYFVYLISGHKMEVAFVCSLLFGLHPMHVESVAWVSGRKDLVYSVFFLAGLITYIKYISTKNIKWLVGTALLFILSALSKPSAVIFPLVLFLVDFILERKTDKRNILEKVPLLLISVVFGLLTLMSQQEVGALGDKPFYSVFQRILFASHSLVIYFVKSMVPFHLSAFHPYPSTKDIPAFFYIAPFLVLGAVAMVFYFLRRKRIIVFGLLFFLVNLLLILQLISVGNAIMAERYTYIPYIGLFFILGSGLSYILRSGKKPIKQWAIPATGAFLLFTAIMGYATFERNMVWKDSESLWSDQIEKYPEQTIGYYNRGYFLSRKEQYKPAIVDYTKALLLNPNYYEAAYNRAQAYRLTGQNEQAIEDYRTAMKIRTTEINPQLNIGLAFLNLKKYSQALEAYNKVVKNYPDQYETWFGRGNAYFFLKDFKNAVSDYTKAIELNPKFSDLWYNRASSYGNMMDKKNAIHDLLKAQELGHAPDTVLMNWLKKLPD
jgi:tetratricopeptide (TPR) repeat protein